jgi:Kinesin-associated protein (KAP).
LEVVVLLGTAATDEGCAMLLCKADILLSLIELLKGNSEAPERPIKVDIKTAVFTSMRNLCSLFLSYNYLFLLFQFL